MLRDYNNRGLSASVKRVLNNGAKGWPMQVIKVSVGHQHQIDGWQVMHLHAGPAQPFQHEQPAGKVGIDDDALSAHLDKKAGVTDECDTQLSIAD